MADVTHFFADSALETGWLRLHQSRLQAEASKRHLCLVFQHQGHGHIPSFKTDVSPRWGSDIDVVLYHGQG